MLGRVCVSPCSPNLSQALWGSSGDGKGVLCLGHMLNQRPGGQRWGAGDVEEKQ